MGDCVVCGYFYFRTKIKPVLDVGSDCKCLGDVNLDMRPDLPVDVVYNLNFLPLPFGNEEFRKVICHHVLEHLKNPVAVLDELVRIARVVDIRVPDCRGSMAIKDKSHKWTFNTKWFAEYAKKRGLEHSRLSTVDWTRWHPIKVPFPLEIRVWLWKHEENPR